MATTRKTFRRWAIGIAALTTLPAWAFNSGSTGVDGPLNPTVSIELLLPPNGVLNYTSVNIPNGVTVTFKRNATNTPVVMLVQGNVTIAGVIDVIGKNAPDSGPVGDGVREDDGLPGAGPIRRGDWFTKLWSQKRNAWAQRVEKDQNALVFLGDSITQGWGEDIGGSLPGVKVANRGISGDTTRGVLIRLKEDVLALKPAGVVLLIGTNDLEENAEPEVIAANLKLIIAELKKHNAKMPIVLCQVFPSSASMKRSSDKIKKVNQLYAAAVKGDARVTFIETHTLFADAQGDA